MATNVYLRERTACDIDRAVEKILRDLGDPDPPLRLESVRELLRLDKGYYSSADDGLLREQIHRLKVAGKQVLRRPALLLEVVKRCDLRALWMPDQKRILIDKDLARPKERWGEAHEIGHSIIPWHEAMTHGDPERTLSASCHEQIEAEANFAAGRLLFLRGRFAEQLLSREVGFDSLRKLARCFGNTLTSTLWRAVEALDQPAFGLVSIHPMGDSDPSATSAVRYLIRSRKFERRFSSVGGRRIFVDLPALCSRRRGPLGAGDIVLNDDAGLEHVFFLECFFNGYEALTLGIHQGPRTARVSVGDCALPNSTGGLT